MDGRAGLLVTIADKNNTYRPEILLILRLLILFIHMLGLKIYFLYF
jgi:hypothetical protein